MQQSARIQSISQQLFGGAIPTAQYLPNEAQLGATLAKLVKPDVQLAGASDQAIQELGWNHRRLPQGNLYFLANTSNHALDCSVRFRDRSESAEIWNPFDGSVKAIQAADAVPLHLAAYDSLLVFFPNNGAAPIVKPIQWSEVSRIDLSHAWHVSFEGTSIQRDYADLHSWTDDASTRFFSGRAVYLRDVQIDTSGKYRSMQFILDFGHGSALPLPSPPGVHNMKAYLDAPVREVAEVFVNGQRAGVVWRPPWHLDVTRWMHGGANSLRIVVANTAINELSGEPQPDLRLLRARYGTLFAPQDMNHLEPIPSGLLGPLTLVRLQAHSISTATH